MSENENMSQWEVTEAENGNGLLFLDGREEAYACFRTVSDAGYVKDLLDFADELHNAANLVVNYPSHWAGLWTQKAVDARAWKTLEHLLSARSPKGENE